MTHVPAISKHLKNIFESGGLVADSVISILETTAADGKYYNPDIHHRRSLRLKGYDYSQAGAYFVTICTQNRGCLFGEILDKEMILNDPGRMVEKWWGELNNKFPQSKTDEYMIMPNHFHGIIVTVGADLRVCPDTDPPVCPDTGEQTLTGEHIGSPLRTVIQWFKTMTTNEYIRGVKQHGWTPFHDKLWHGFDYTSFVEGQATVPAQPTY
ncbi:MAG: transposase [Desulfuromusa sp.]|nr:transposase [Desulfuromusa sp.]